MGEEGIDDVDEMLVNDAILTSIPQEERQLETRPWSCSACTFVNSDDKQACELCSTKREMLLKTPELENATAPSNLSEDEWPSLQEAADSFIHCEVSSVGSSWLDLEERSEFFEDES